MEIKKEIEKEVEKISDQTEKAIKKSWKTKKNVLILSSVLVLISLIAGFASIGLLAYKTTPPTKGIVHWATGVFPYPAAIVNQDIIRYSDWEREYLRMQAFVDSTDQKVDSQAIEDNVFEKLIHEALVKQIAKKNDIHLTNEEVDTEIAAVQQELASSDTTLEAVVQQEYGWTVDEFRKVFIEPSMLESKVLKSLIDKRVAEVYSALDAGESFEDLAKKYSDDTGSAENGGSLGLAVKGSFVPEFEEAALALEPGEVSDPVESQFGVHIIKLVQIVPANEAEGTPMQFEAKHILISRAVFDDALTDFTDNSRVWRFLSFASADAQ